MQHVFALDFLLYLGNKNILDTCINTFLRVTFTGHLNGFFVLFTIYPVSVYLSVIDNSLTPTFKNSS